MIDTLVSLGPDLLEQVKQRGALIDRCDTLRWKLHILLQQYNEHLPAEIAETKAGIRELETQINALLIHDK